MADDDQLQTDGQSESSQPPEENAVDPWIGQVLGNYVLIQRLGEGGMGVVYLAHDEVLDRMAAVKFLPLHMASDVTYVERFLREARGAAKLNHPNMVSVYEAGCLGENTYYFVMEYVAGRDMGSLLRDLKVLAVPGAVDCIRQVAAALDYAHTRDIIHRDIKPENLMFTNTGIVKVCDLGLAKQLETDSDIHLTRTQVIMGTALYIAPEQIRSAKDVDGRADIYSLGASFFHLVTGRIPYEGESKAVIMVKHLKNPVPEPHHANPDLDADICAIIKTMMAKKPEDRFQTMGEVDAILADYQLRKTHPPQPLSELAATIPDLLLQNARVLPSAGSVKAVPVPTRRNFSLRLGLMMGVSLLVASFLGYLAALFVENRDQAGTLVESSKPVQSAATPAPTNSNPVAQVATPETETNDVQTREILIPSELSSEPEGVPATVEANPQTEQMNRTEVDAAGRLAIADFEKSNFLDNLGGKCGIFSSQNPRGKSKFNVVNVSGPDGVATKSCRLDYDVSNRGSYAGFWMHLPKLDATDYRTLSFKIKGEVENKTTTFKVNIHQGANPPGIPQGSVAVRDIGADWKTVNIPLDDFALPARKPLNSLAFVVIGMRHDAPPGFILIDDVMLLKKDLDGGASGKAGVEQPVTIETKPGITEADRVEKPPAAQQPASTETQPPPASGTEPERPAPQEVSRESVSTGNVKTPSELSSTNSPAAAPVTPLEGTALAPAKDMILADFDHIDPDGKIPGAFGFWGSATLHNRGKCQAQIDPTGGTDDSGALLIDYDVSESSSGAYVYMDMPGFDATDYKAITFRVKNKGSSVVDFYVQLKVLVNEQVLDGRFLVRGVGSRWKTVKIPIKDLKLPALTPIVQFMFMFHSWENHPKKGELLIDDITFLKK